MFLLGSETYNCGSSWVQLDCICFFWNFAKGSQRALKLEHDPWGGWSCPNQIVVDIFRVESYRLLEKASDFSMVDGLAHHEFWRRVDEVRALILAETIRREYLEDLLKDNRSAGDKTLKKKHYSRMNRKS